MLIEEMELYERLSMAYDELEYKFKEIADLRLELAKVQMRQRAVGLSASCEAHLASQFFDPLNHQAH